MRVFKNKLGKDKELKQVEKKINRTFIKIKIIFINSIYLIFSFLELFVIYEYLHGIFFNFTRFKIMHPVEARTFLDIVVIFFWLVFSFKIYKFNKKFIKKNRLCKKWVFGNN